MRLDKYLTTLGIGSRTQVKELIKKGKITVNGEKILKPDIHIDENNDEVDLNGVNLKYNKFYYYMLNKPAGVLSAVSDNNCKTVIDLLDVTPKKGLFPVGRLDKDTEGLLLFSSILRMAGLVRFFSPISKPFSNSSISLSIKSPLSST